MVPPGTRQLRAVLAEAVTEAVTKAVTEAVTEAVPGFMARPSAGTIRVDAGCEQYDLSRCTSFHSVVCMF
jgi:hypothetical protein